MAEFKESQKKYNNAKKALEAAAKEDYLARQQVLMIDKQINFYLKSKQATRLPAKHPLGVQRTPAVKKATASQAKLDAAKKALTAARQEFKSSGTASQVLSNMDDGIPVMLLPLKLQTRFVTIKHIARNIPDELLVDVNALEPFQQEQLRSVFPSFKPVADPLASISSQAYMLSNSANPIAKRLALSLSQDLISRAGKKRWQKVEDSFALCIRIFPDDIFLQTHETAITENELASAKTFWQQMWDAERVFGSNQGDAAAIAIKNDSQLAAWRQLRFECLSHRANWLVRIMRPPDFPDNFSTDLITIPDNKFPVPEMKSESWTIPPTTELLPEQFVVKVFFKNPDLQPREVAGAAIPDYVQMGFDPDEKDENAFAEKELVLELPKAIRWLTDLDEAEKIGMAVRLPLSVLELVSGISKLVVMGVKTTADAAEGGRLVTKLFENHRYRPDGMAFLPQGTATNNLPGRPAGFSNAGLSDEESFHLAFPPATALDPLSDGQRFAAALGLDAGMVTGLFDNEGRDAEKALQMNRALWPGTLGYYLDNLMRPNLTDTDIAFTKSFFQHFVTGRGLLPSFRIGKQPYGVVPATSWQSWKPAATASAEETRLVNFLKKMDTQWAGLVSQVKTMKKVFANTDEATMKREFRELLAYQASSTRYFRRLVAGEYLLWNTNNRNNPAGTEKAGIRTTPAEYKATLEGATAWNAPVNPRPRMLGKFMDDDNYKLTDTAPEDAGVTTPLMGDGKNYLGILLDATLDQLKSNSFGDDFGKFVIQRSSRLLFYMARFSILQEWISAATAMVKKEKPAISPLARLDFEMEYVGGGTTPSNEHKALLTAAGIAGTFETRKNKWAFFDEILSDGTKVGDTISQKIKDAMAAGDPLQTLKETKAAMTALSGLPVDELEKIFSEHIDLCSFRLDAWLQGLVLSRLSDNRAKTGFEKGIFIGAYGYLENLVPDTDRWIQVQEVADPKVVLSATAGTDNLVMPVYDFSDYKPQQTTTVKQFVFVYLGSDPTTNLVQDSNGQQIIQTQVAVQNQDEGFLLTPSLEHAATAGILRAGYEHHALSQGAESKTLSVNINSERTGLAMDMIKGINAGHSLNEQLGYFIERRMYDNADLAQFIPNMRAAFPLHIERNEWDDNQNIQEADKITNLSLVADGLAIIHANDAALTTQVWTQKLTEIFGANQIAKNNFGAIVNQAKNQFDAISDLVLAESVFQMVKGSPERAAAALRIVNDGSDIVLPEIAQVPAENHLVTHRMAFVLNIAGNLEKSWPTNDPVVSVLARISPDLNRWLADQLPAPDKIVAKVTDGKNVSVKLSLKSLGIQAIDFYYLMQKTGSRPQESLLAWFFTEAAKKKPGIDAASLLQVSFGRETGFGVNEFSIRELMPLIRSIGALLEKSRPMRPQDWQLSPDSKANTTEVYDNSALLAVCNEFAGSAENSPIPAFLKKLDTASKALQQNFPAGYGSPESDIAFSNLLTIIPQAYLLGFWDALPRCPEICDPTNAKILLEQAAELTDSLQKRLDKAGSQLADIASAPVTTSGEQTFDSLVKLARLFAGEDFMVLPKFHLLNPAEIKAAFADATLTASIKEFGTEEWLQGLAMVRENAKNYQTIINLRETLNAPAIARKLRILQLPFIAGVSSVWAGSVFPEGFVPPANITSMAFEFSANFVNTQLLSGIMIDDWREKIPLPALTTGAAIHYNEADSEAPQCLLLAVAPEQKGAWEWNSLFNTVIETMMLAKKRAVDAEIIQTTWLSQFLPAVVTPIDTKNNTPNMDFRWCGPVIKTTPIIDIGGLGHLFTKST